MVPEPDTPKPSPRSKRLSNDEQNVTDNSNNLTVSREELLVSGHDQLFRKLVHDLFAFNARHEAIRAGHAKRIGLAGIEYTLLISVARLSRGSNVNVKTLADHLHVSTGFVTNVTKKLQDMGLLQKSVDPNDKRRTVLTVTEEGRMGLAKLAPYQRQVNDVEFGSLTKDDFQKLSSIISDLVPSSERAVKLQRYLESDDSKV